jgi:glycosyltransferase involved in cell wall biosynthesis
MQLNKPLRIAYAIQNVGGIDFSRDIGDTVPVKQTLRGLINAGHEVTCLRLLGRSVVGADDPNNLEEFWAARLGLSGSRPFLGFESGVRRLQRLLRFPYLALFDTYRFYEACIRYLPNYDLCHEHNGLLSAGAALACLRLKIPYVLTFSADPIFELGLVGKPLRGLRLLLGSKEANLTYRLARKIICVSEGAKSMLEDGWGVETEKIVVLPNGVDVDFFGRPFDPIPIQSELELDGNPVVGFVGGFQLWHGLELLVESFAQVKSEVPNAKLLLVGDGPARAPIENKISELGLKSSVIITGLVEQSRVAELLSVIDIAAIPYPRFPRELWFSPLKLYEYMAAGKAIVASKAGQISEVIQDGHNGILIDSGNVRGFSQAIINLLKNPIKMYRLGENARSQARRHHSWDRYIHLLEEVYQSVL